MSVDLINMHKLSVEEQTRLTRDFVRNILIPFLHLSVPGFIEVTEITFGQINVTAICRIGKSETTIKVVSTQFLHELAEELSEVV